MLNRKLCPESRPWQVPSLVPSDCFTVEFTAELFFQKSPCVPSSSLRDPPVIPQDPARPFVLQEAPVVSLE